MTLQKFTGHCIFSSFPAPWMYRYMLTCMHQIKKGEQNAMTRSFAVRNQILESALSPAKGCGPKLLKDLRLEGKHQCKELCQFLLEKVHFFMHLDSAH